MPGRRRGQSWYESDTDEALRLIEQPLRVVDKLGAAPIDVRGVQMADRTLVVEFTVDKSDTNSLLGEVANLMGVLSLLNVLDSQHCGVHLLIRGRPLRSKRASKSSP